MNNIIDANSLVFSTDRVKLPPTSEGILSVLRNILSYPVIQSVLLDSSSEFIEVGWYHKMGESLVTNEPDITTGEIVENIPDLTESSYEGRPLEIITRVIHEIDLLKLTPGYILVGDMDSFQNWLGIETFSQEIGGDPHFLGLRVLEVAIIGAYSFVVCGGNVSGASLAKVRKGIRVVMESQNV
jgi:hypothetical protein